MDRNLTISQSRKLTTHDRERAKQKSRPPTIATDAYFCFGLGFPASDRFFRQVPSLFLSLGAFPPPFIGT